MSAPGHVALIGGTGFLGRHVCQSLHASGIGGTSISPRPATGFLAAHAPGIVPMTPSDTDLRDRLGRASHVIYFAHRSRPASNPADTRAEIETNLIDACRFAETLFDANPDARLIYLSSGGQIYGRDHSSPIREDAPLRPVTTYGLGKAMIEDMLGYYARAFGARVQILRLGNPVGRWQLNTSHGLVSAAVMKALRGEPLHIYGAGTNARDYFDADDFGDFLTGQVTSADFVTGVFNIGSGIAKTELDIVADVRNTLSRPLDCHHEPARSFDLPYGVLDASRAQQDLGWAARTPLTQTIEKLAAAASQA